MGGEGHTCSGWGRSNSEWVAKIILTVHVEGEGEGGGPRQVRVDGLAGETHVQVFPGERSQREGVVGRHCSSLGLPGAEGRGGRGRGRGGCFGLFLRPR